jgi:hypothetical protein
LKTISDDKVSAKHDDGGRNMKSEYLADFIKLISDDKSLLILNTIFLASGDSSDILIKQLKLTRKQYYSRITRLVKGRVKRQKGRYFLTSFGVVIYDAQRLLGNAVKNYWKLKAIDSFGVANKEDSMPKEERNKIIEQMISNQQIKEILVS